MHAISATLATIKRSDNFIVPSFASKLAQRRIHQAGFSTTISKPGLSQFDGIFNWQNLLESLQPTAIIVDGKPLDRDMPVLNDLAGKLIWLQDDEIALSPEFFVATESAAAPRPGEKKIVTTVKRIAVALEGPRSGSRAVTVLKTLDGLNSKSLTIDVCIDRDNPQYELELLMDVCSGSKHSVRVHRDQSRIQSLLPNLDLAIVNCRPACLQMAFFGIPTIAVADCRHANSLGTKMQNRNAVELVSASDDMAELAAAAGSLIRSRPRRRQLSISASQFVDGQGARRIIELLSGEMATLKKAS